jgi:hypothetical protein
MHVFWLLWVVYNKYIYAFNPVYNTVGSLYSLHITTILSPGFEKRLAEYTPPAIYAEGIGCLTNCMQ